VGEHQDALECRVGLIRYPNDTQEEEQTLVRSSLIKDEYKEKKVRNQK